MVKDTREWLLMILCAALLSAADRINDSGCADRTTEEFFSHKNLQACAGQWTGHIENSSSLCAPGWSVCSWKEHHILESVTWKEAITLQGCYAVNAAQDTGRCTECRGELEMDDMAGVGADCPHQNVDKKSCISGGRIDVSCCVDTHHRRACTYKPGISTGILCCKQPGTVPKFVVAPPHVISVMRGLIISLSCQVVGIPRPTVHWFKDGIQIRENPRIIFVSSGDLLILLARKSDSGRYNCIAANKMGKISSQTTVGVKGIESGCADRTTEGLHHFLDVHACRGRWSGHVRNGGDLCSPGWTVCGVEHQNVLQWIRWSDSEHIEGCYAYNAANTHNECARCKKYNMAGIGRGCSRQRRSILRQSCLMYGRIDVYPSRQVSSCEYTEGLTTGVMCCRKHHNHRSFPKTRHRISCTPPCRNEGICVSRNKCQCAIDYKGAWCQIEIKKQGSPINKNCFRDETCSCGGDTKCLRMKQQHHSCVLPCLNGGRCHIARCICPKSFWGKFCHLKVDKYFLWKPRSL